MPKRLRISLIVLGLLLLLLGGLGGWLYFGIHGVPDFYAKALGMEPARQKQGSDQMLRRVASLSNATRRDGPWQVTFTAEQINGWLAVGMKENYPDALPLSIKDPRVVIRPGELDMGCRYKSRRLRAILSLTADVYLQAPDVIAMRIRSARAGLVPLPLAELVDRLTTLFENLGCRVTRQEIDADPLLLLAWPQPRSHPGRNGTIHIDAIELREGELFVAGHTQRTKPAGSR